MANQKPLEEVRIGTVKAAIWQNDVAGKTRYSVTFSRIYRDADGQGRRRRASGATTCWFSPRLRIARTRACSSCSRPRRRPNGLRETGALAAGSARRWGLPLFLHQHPPPTRETPLGL